MTRPFVARAGLVLGAAAAGLLVWLVSVPSLGVEIVVAVPASLATDGRPGRHVVEWDQVAMVATGVGVLAWAFVAVLERITQYAPAIWLSCALPGLILSLAGPLTATTAATMICLAGMHLAVGVVLILGLALIPGPGRDRSGSPVIQNICPAGPTVVTRRPT